MPALAGRTRAGYPALKASMAATGSPASATTASPVIPPVIASPVTRLTMEEMAAGGIL